MKKFTLFLILICCVSMAKAQLTVNSSGNVGIKVTPSNTYPLYVKGELIGINSIISKTNPSSSDTQISVNGLVHQYGPETSIGVKGHVFGLLENGKNVGVWGESNGNSSCYNYGVAGYLRGINRGAAIIGTTNTNSTYPFMDRRYAGYFEGDVRVTGSITINNTISGVVLGLPSDGSSSEVSLPLKTGDIYTKLLSLKTKSFFISKSESREGNNNDISDKQLLSKQHYGLDADQLEEVFPDLVYENEDGSKSINYVEMVPILVQAINELKAELTELRGSDEKTQTRASEGDAKRDEMGENVTLLSLGENRPNPFSNTTTIPVSIPEDVQRAFIYIYDLTGKKVLQLDITARGKQNITLDASPLTDGMYLYSLIADGKVVQTRRMIIEK